MEGDSTRGKLDSFTQTLGLRDMWRSLHLRDRGYSHYSGAHNMHSRIDYLFTTGDTQARFRSVEYQARGISDRSPLVAVIDSKTPKPRGQWRMETWCLAIKEVVTHLDTETQHYFTVNPHSVDSPMLAWEAYKATLHGAIITGEIGGRRQRQERMTSLEEELHGLERDYAQNPTPTCIDDMDLKHAEYQAVARNEVKRHTE
ncbi:hypothetical protein NDU88_007604 [Pleurodeles waltl]|uniref:Uncharacterized protein n=1 Tax=Pleurodeles waltl TaxID=8319 RepID=A0AAV7ST79_PLEWA|nr:hypothetical protein NDU88_007604 [Pleurodeles waltl]